jgi:hypothetical protein
MITAMSHLLDLVSVSVLFYALATHGGTGTGR